MGVHRLLALSNLLGVAGLVRLLWRGHYGHATLTAWVMVSSFLMHITETKHQLRPGPIWRAYSRLFLNQDRAMTYIVGTYVTVLWWQSPGPKGMDLAIGLAGAALCRIGETRTQSRVFNQTIYPICHLLWHATVYYLLFRLL